MDLLDWHEDYSVGIDELDQQHQQLVCIINELAGAIAGQCQQQALPGLFQRLFSYIDFHFRSEARYFERLSTADQQLHHLQHKHFIEHLSAARQQFNDMSLSADELLYWLSDWLMFHIKVEDKKFASTPLHNDASAK